jgi:hypothetical protein
MIRPATPVQRVIHEDCQWTAHVRGIEDEILEDAASRALSRSELVHHIGYVAGAHYRLVLGFMRADDAKSSSQQMRCAPAP